MVVADEDIAAETRRSLAVRALRAVSPRAVAPETAQEAGRVLADLLAADRGPGRPTIGPPTTVRLPADMYVWLDDLAKERGWVDAAGEAQRARTIRSVLDHARGS